MEMENDILDRLRELAVARLEVSSPDVYFSSGITSESISRDQMIRHVESGDDIGNKFIETQLEFLRAFKDGTLISSLTLG